MTETTDLNTAAAWGFPNFRANTKAHLFKEGRAKSACGKYDRNSVAVLSTAMGGTDPYVYCHTCAERA